MAWDSERTDINVYSQGEVEKWVYSTCNICSVGCGCYIAVNGNRIVGIKGNAKHPVNRGRLGPKGENQWHANNSPDRLLTPLLRHGDGVLRPVSWDDAMAVLVDKSKEALRKFGSEGIAIYSTGQGMLEDYYTIAKIGRAGLRSHLLDANTRLCTATTEWCLLQSFGADGTPAGYEDIDVTDTLMLFGHNVAETGTVLFERIMTRKKKTGKPYIIVVDPRRTWTAQAADLHLQILPGANLALLNGITHLLLKNGWIDRDFIAKHTVGFADVEQAVSDWTLERTAKETDVPETQIAEAAKRIGTTPRLVCTTLQGAYQSVDATATCIAINNIHLLRGLIGKPGCGPLHMAGQPSSSTNRTVGGVGSYPAHRNPSNPKHIQEMADLWNVDPAHLEVGPEKDIESFIDKMERGQLGLFWNIHTNPMVSLPNRLRARRAFERTFVVVQDCFLTETCEVADLILPTAMWGEKEGLMENADRMINVSEVAVTPPPGVRSDFDILLDYARRMDFRDKDGKPLIQYTTPRECFEEWKRVSKGRPCDMTAMTYEKIKAQNGMQWPADAEHPNGTPRLYQDLVFHTQVDDAQTYGFDMKTGRARTREEFEALGANGKAILYGLTYYPSAEQPSARYPFWLTTGRVVWHWHTRTKTGRAPALHMATSQGYVEIHPDDATLLGILPGELVRVSSPRGDIVVPARIVDTIRPGLVFVPFHFGSWQAHQAANELTVDLVDPISKQPVYKQSACRIEKLRQLHTVARGETFVGIAERYQLTAEQLAKANRMLPPYRADVGSQLEIPSIENPVSPPYMLYRKLDLFPQFRLAKLDPHQEHDDT
ncbi:molybdopterin oxidoreductase [Alicyclobacillus hesperidum subsp. aegles]|uniref:molybdopterin-dependent oxidoreductase n=1 Tax=Alicyclobacillus hesperidum TaxID=89784 RepID=UPI00222914E6|nr:molybdopterin-dependent oxidoreductase [Alicyclobacillus hesperidum]GLG02331.1 molybdopterin oxidoreductase [Alicyclobacillus hesperidum subsp. aegles]